MNKKLPFVFPPIETYQGLSFVLGCVLANEKEKSLYINRYINIECAKTNNIFDLQIYFCKSLWGDYWEDGLAELDLYEIKNINSKKFYDFINERINQNNYSMN